MVLFIALGDQQHEAMLAKYSGLQYADIDKNNKIGTFSRECPILNKVQDKQQRRNGCTTSIICLLCMRGWYNN
jgi:hypothetical protein